MLSPQATLNDFRAVAVSKDHVLDLISLTARGFGGEFMSSALIDASRKTPRISVKGHAKKLEIGSLLKVAGADTKLSGELFSQFKLRAAGKDTEALLAALNGVVDMTVNDVALPQNDLSRNLFSVVNFLAPRLLGTHRESGESKKHDIGSNAKLKGRFQIENGVARNKNLRATNDIIDVKGRGSLNFPEQKINYSLQIGLLDAKDKRRIPMKIRGALDDPSFHVDFNSLVRQETERLIDSELGKVKESVGEKLGKEAQRLKEKLPKKALEFLKDKLKL